MARRNTYNWNEGALERLKALWFQGLATREIAERMGCTKNSIIGKAHALGLPHMVRIRARRDAEKGSKEAPALPKPSPKPKSEPKPRRTVRTPKPPFIPSKRELKPTRQDGNVEPQPLMLNIDALQRKSCRWVYGDVAAGDYGYCGHEAAPDSHYCTYHDGKMYRSNFRERLNRDAERYKSN